MPLSTILLIRHAAKLDPARDIRGVDIHGHESAAELSVAGWQRSGALPRLFSPAQTAEMLPRPDVIFAAASHSRSARPARTVELLVQTLGQTVREEHGSDDVQGLVGAVRACDGVVAVCWRHESIAAIARAWVTPQGSRLGCPTLRRGVGAEPERRRMGAQTTAAVAAARRSTRTNQSVVRRGEK